MVPSESATTFEQVFSIQELVKKPLTSVPQRYLQQQYYNEPSLFPDETLSQALPIINLKKLIHGEDTELELEKLNSACRDWGFFQVSKLRCLLHFHFLTSFFLTSLYTYAVGGAWNKPTSAENTER